MLTTLSSIKKSIPCLVAVVDYHMLTTLSSIKKSIPCLVAVVDYHMLTTLSSIKKSIPCLVGIDDCTTHVGSAAAPFGLGNQTVDILVEDQL